MNKEHLIFKYRSGTLSKVNNNYRPHHVHVSIRIRRCGFHELDFREMSNLKFLLAFVKTFRFYREAFHSVPNIVLIIVNNLKNI